MRSIAASAIGTIRLPSRTNTRESALVGWRVSFARNSSGTVRHGLCTCDGAFKPVSPERLEDIIDSAEFKGRDGVLVVRRSEDDLRLIVELPENLEASSSGHHHVEKNQFRALLVCKRNRSFSVSGLVNLAGPAETSEVLAKSPASQGLIVGD